MLFFAVTFFSQYTFQKWGGYAGLVGHLLGVKHSKCAFKKFSVLNFWTTFTYQSYAYFSFNVVVRFLINAGLFWSLIYLQPGARWVWFADSGVTPLVRNLPVGGKFITSNQMHGSFSNALSIEPTSPSSKASLISPAITRYDAWGIFSSDFWHGRNGNSLLVSNGPAITGFVDTSFLRFWAGVDFFLPCATKGKNSAEYGFYYFKYFYLLSVLYGNKEYTWFSFFQSLKLLMTQFSGNVMWLTQNSYRLRRRGLRRRINRYLKLSLQIKLKYVGVARATGLHPKTVKIIKKKRELFEAFAGESRLKLLQKKSGA